MELRGECLLDTPEALGSTPAPQKGGKSTLKSSLEAGCARMAGAPFNPSTTEAEVYISL